jgi:hypothetical protein
VVGLLSQEKACGEGGKRNSRACTRHGAPSWNSKSYTSRAGLGAGSLRRLARLADSKANSNSKTESTTVYEAELTLCQAGAQQAAPLPNPTEREEVAAVLGLGELLSWVGVWLLYNSRGSFWIRSGEAARCRGHWLRGGARIKEMACDCLPLWAIRLAG